jgi:hypothetical protein
MLLIAGFGVGHLFSSKTSYSRSYYSAALRFGSSFPRLRGYSYLVRVKTSITLPKELLDRFDRVDMNRSALLERAALAHLAAMETHERGKRDIAIINRNSRRLNREAMDTLEYQRVR